MKHATCQYWGSDRFWQRSTTYSKVPRKEEGPVIHTIRVQTYILCKILIARTETPWPSIHGHGWSRPGHQWIQFVGGHCKFHRWPWMVHGWSTTGHRWSFEKIFRTKIRSRCESSKCTLVNAKFELASHCVIEN